MCCASLFTCIMTINSYFLIIFIFRKRFRFFFCKYNILLHLDMIFVLFLLTAVFFFFSKSVIYLVCFLKKSQNFFINLFHDIKYVCFLYDQIPKLLALNIYKEYAYIFSLLKIFLIYF